MSNQSWMDAAGDVLGSPWMFATIAVVGGLVAGRVIGAVLRSVLGRLARRSEAAWDDQLVVAATAPFSALLGLLCGRAALPWLPLDPRARDVVATVLAVGTTAMILWLLFRLVDVAHAVLGQRSWAATRPSTRSLLAIGARFAKVVIVLVTGIAALAQFGVAVSSLVAGLGIGGLAVALAAQKTVENLFGTVSIGVDQPLREGDFVKIGGDVGTVESIGLRSTRIRSLDRTVVTLPNGQLADQRIESFTVRDRMRLSCTLGLVYDTSADQLRRILIDLETTLRSHEKIWPDTVAVHFVGYGESSLDVEIMAWFQTQDWSEFQRIRQDVLLQFMDVIARNGTAFAFPTRTVHAPAPVSTSQASAPS